MIYFFFWVKSQFLVEYLPSGIFHTEDILSCVCITVFWGFFCLCSVTSHQQRAPVGHLKCTLYLTETLLYFKRENLKIPSWNYLIVSVFQCTVTVL